MSALRQAVLLVAGAACCLAFNITENPSIPEHVLVANLILEQLKDHMEAELAPLRGSVEEVKEAVQACNQVYLVDTPAHPPPPLPNPVAEDISTRLLSLENKVNDAIRNMDVLEGKLDEKIEPLATTVNVRQVQETLTAVLEDTVRFVESQVDEIATKTEVKEVVKEVQTVKAAVMEVQETCGNDEKVTELLQTVREVNGKVEEVKVEAQATNDQVEQCVAQEAVEEVRGVKEMVEGVWRQMEELRGELEEELEGIGGTMEEISNLTHQLTVVPPPPPPPQEEEEEEGPVYPCLDSTFVGTRSDKVCSLAVRFNKCRLPTVSYHCCLTCTKEDQIPEMGPWRHVLLPRTVASLGVIRFFVP